MMVLLIMGISVVSNCLKLPFNMKKYIATL